MMESEDLHLDAHEDHEDRWHRLVEPSKLVWVFWPQCHRVLLQLGDATLSGTRGCQGLATPR